MSKKTVDAILESGADYVLSVKKNQPELFECIKDSFQYQLNDEFEKLNNPLPTSYETKMGHGRFERRTAYVDYNVGWCERLGHFKNCQAFALIVRKCEENDKKTIENHYYICSQKYTPTQILSITSQEWGVEAMHWSLDNTLGEDKCTIASKSKLIISNIVRKISLGYIYSLITSNHIKDTLRGYMKCLSFNPQMLLN